MDWSFNKPMREGQVANPFVYTEHIDLSNTNVLEPSEEQLNHVFPTPRHSLKTWGRTPGTLVLDPHWIGVRKQTSLHFDPRYPKYTHHLLLKTDHFVLRGYDKVEMEISRGLFFIMDGHSPHQLLSKAKEANWYIAVSMDSHEILDRDTVVAQLIKYASEAPFITDEVP